MNRFIMFLISGMLISTTASAQPGPDTLWTRFYGWSGNDTAFCIKQRTDGGFVIAGTVSIPQEGQTDAFIVETDANGLIQSLRNYGGAYNQGAKGIVETNDGGYAFAGYSSDANGQLGMYYGRVSSSGDVVCSQAVHVQDRPNWATSIDQTGTGSYRIPVVSALSSGESAMNLRSMNYFPPFCEGPWSIDYVSGSMQMHNVHCVGPNLTGMVGYIQGSSSAHRQASLWFFASGGPTVWYNFGGGSADDDAYDFVAVSDGFLLAGSTYDGRNDGIFLCKTDLNAAPDWIFRYYSEYGKWVEAACPATGGGYLVAGTFVTYWGDTDMLLAKVNGQGEIVWQSTYGTGANEQAYDVEQTGDGGIVLVGYSTAHVGVQAEWYIVKTLPDPELATPDIGNPVPQQYSLSAFPNPFNPSTTMVYDLPKAGRVGLRVFDLLGREVAVLTDGFVEAGTHRVTFDGSALASGIYFARLDAGAFSQTKKLMLLK